MVVVVEVMVVAVVEVVVVAAVEVTQAVRPCVPGGARYWWKLVGYGASAAVTVSGALVVAGSVVVASAVASGAQSCEAVFSAAGCGGGDSSPGTPPRTECCTGFGAHSLFVVVVEWLGGAAATDSSRVG